MAAGDLTSLVSARGWLSIAAPTDTQNTSLTRLISAASSRIQTYLGYQLASQNYTRYLDGGGGARIMLPDRPVTAVSSVAIDGQPVPARIGQNPGFVFDSNSVALVGGYRFSRGLQNVAIAYTAGYAEIPPDIEQACLEWVSGSFQAQMRDPAVVEIKAGDTSEKYGAAEAVLGNKLIPMPSGILAALLSYRRVSM